VHGAGLVDEKGPRDSVHLILQWSEPVQVKAVLAKLYTLCPDLKQYQDKIWPNGGSNMRAPLSYYTQPDASGWCTLVSPLTGEKQQHGPEAWRLLLSHRADPATAPGLPAEPPAPKPEPTLRSAQAATTAASTGTGPQFRACDAIKWFNSLHTLDDIHPRATKTHALAVWRQETVPSVKYNDSGPYAGKAFDYGTKEWMDPFSLWWHVKGYAKDDAVRQVMRDYRVYLLSQSRRN
jgi:hypothetical protein